MSTPGEATREAIRSRSRLINDTAAEIRRLLEEAAGEIRAILAAQPGDYQQWALPRLQDEIRRLLGGTAAEAASVADLSQQQAWRGGSAMVDAVLVASTAPAGGVALSAVLPLIDEGQLAAMRTFLTEKIKGATLDAVNAINTQLGLTVIGAQTPFDAVRAVTETLGEKTTRRATTIVHTELARAYSAASQQRMAQWSAEMPGLRKKWLKSGKRQPRLHHHVIHGQIQPVDKPFLLKGGTLKMMYPHDPAAPASETINCGCLAVPVLPEDEGYGFKRTLPPSRDDLEAAENRAALARRPR